MCDKTREIINKTVDTRSGHASWSIIVNNAYLGVMAFSSHASPGLNKIVNRHTYIEMMLHPLYNSLMHDLLSTENTSILVATVGCMTPFNPPLRLGEKYKGQQLGGSATRNYGLSVPTLDKRIHLLLFLKPEEYTFCK